MTRAGCVGGGFVVVSDERDAAAKVQATYGAILGGGVRF